MFPVAYLNDVTVGVFGISADVDGEEWVGSVVGYDGLEHILKIVLVPGSANVPAFQLEKE